MLRDRLDAIERRVMLDRGSTTERIELHDHSLDDLKHAMASFQQRLKDLGSQGVVAERSIRQLSKQVEELEDIPPQQAPDTSADDELDRRMSKVERQFARLARELRTQARRIGDLDRTAADAVLTLARLKE